MRGIGPDVTQTTTRVQIRPLQTDELELFFSYLGRQLHANGKEGHPLFQPVSRAVVSFPADKQWTFTDGMAVPVGQPRWRRAWVALDADDIVGHVDLRAHAEAHTQHRALLGMGLLSSHFRLGIGRQLVEFVLQWAASRGIEYVDLSVLSGNLPAIGLYESSGFQRLCHINDMFRIDGHSESEIMMTRRINF